MPDHETPTPKPTPKWEDTSAPSSIGLQWLREIVTAAIAITILIITAVMLMETFHSAKYLTVIGETDAARQAEIAQRDKAFNNQKDILLYGLALLGTVTGYFFGRVPAELHAVQAQKAANVAEDRANDAKDAENKAKTDKARIVDKTMQTVNQALSLAPFAPNAARGIPGETQAVANVATARQDLEELRNWLRGFQA